jgi:radical SAM protein with 4Fe4S-binding SPASM domain
LDGYTFLNQRKEKFNKGLKKRLLKLIHLAEKNYSQTLLSVSMVLCPPEVPESPHIKDFIAEWIDNVHNIFLWQKIDFSQGIKYTYRDGIDEHLKRRRVCEQPFSYLAVLSDGRISTCCNTSRTIFNSINIDSGLEYILTSKEYQGFLENHLSLKLQDTACQDCELWLDSWLGDEKLSISLEDGRQCQVFVEGSSYRIKGKS